MITKRRENSDREPMQKAPAERRPAMPIRMPDKTLITVQKRYLRSDYRMPQMEMAQTHFGIGFLISGDRRIITPQNRFDAHAGDVTVMPPHLYHRTFSLSSEPYVSYLIKVSDRLAADFCREIDYGIWQRIFDQKLLTFSSEDSSRIGAHFEDMFRIYEEKASYRDILLRGMLYRLILLLNECDRKATLPRFRSELSDAILNATFYIEQHYAEEFRLSDAAGAAGFSEGHFSRLFASQVGVPFSRYLTNVRIRHAKELLLNTKKPVSEIALDTGFSNADYFSSCFSKREGITPLAFRRSHGT